MHWNEIRRIAKSKRANAFGNKPTQKEEVEEEKGKRGKGE